MSLKPKDVHIVVRDFALNTINHSKFYQEEEILWFSLKDDLCIGPICDLNTAKGFNKRKDWLEETFGDLIYRDKIFNALNKDIATISDLSDVAKSSNDIYIWTGFNALELISTARVLNQIANLKNRIFLLDLSSFQFVNLWNEVVIPNSVAVISHLQIEEVSHHFNQIDTSEILKWKSLWNEVQSGESELRVKDDDGSISKKPYSYFDESLLLNCTDEFIKAARIIGHSLMDIDFAVGDEFLNWRLKELVKNKKLEFIGTLKDLRDYQVKLIS